jgi:hypothetical protein
MDRVTYIIFRERNDWNDQEEEGSFTYLKNRK